eukprot:GHVS01028956.1.p1 GENE.GHVS01028956.1~~GHVS01028956.1.p1  ORF type:complete len:379 (+),score=70.07 GHVS01028956.1:120-1256(+)
MKELLGVKVQQMGVVSYVACLLLFLPSQAVANQSTTPRNPPTSSSLAPLSPLLLFLSSLTPHISSTAASLLPVPLSGSGNCTAGAVYSVASYKQVYSLLPQLECVFASAVAIPRVPVGAMYGRMLLIGNTAFWDAPMEKVFQGDWVVQTRCHSNDPVYNSDGKREFATNTDTTELRSADNPSGTADLGGSFDLFLNVLKLAGIGVRSGVWYVPPTFPYPRVTSGEYLNVITPTLVNELGFDISANCPPYVPKQFTPSNNQLPVRLFVDQLRAIGTDEEDGCLLMLGRTFLKNSDQHVSPQFVTHNTPAVAPAISVVLSTFMYWLLKTCDPTVLPSSLGLTSSLPPLKESFNYTRPGLTQLLSQMVEAIGSTHIKLSHV